ncbi:MAG TPA: NAD-dependent epimerase/dehydratase family protein [Solirubrobacteraceae bacterium]|nr:NAD-dependent epimerase/dehydratase family protein [Solirubrobacteraceae bacterium]
MRILLTGASGFIGSHVAAELRNAGAEVRAFCRTEPPPEARVAEWRPGDVRDADAVRQAVEGCEAVVHMAALYSYRRSDAGLMELINVEGTRNVLDAAARQGVGRVLCTSSSATCGPVPGRPATEQDSPPAWELKVPYKRTKVEAERLAASAAREGLETVCVNPTTVVGPGDRQPTPSGKMISDLVEGRMVGYLRRTGLNVVSVRDVAQGHRLALEYGHSGRRYILGSQDLQLRDAFAVVGESVGLRPPRVAVPWPVAFGVALGAELARLVVGREPRLLVLDEVRLARLPLFFSSDRARSELGYKPRPGAEALAAAARWFAGSRPRRDFVRATATTTSAGSG